MSLVFLRCGTDEKVWERAASSCYVLHSLPPWSPGLSSYAVRRSMTQYAGEVKLFGKWSFEDVEVKDMSLEDYIACRPKYAQFLPHSQGRWQKKRFRKAQCPIVERMVCSMMRTGRNNGKKVMALRIVKHAFEIIHLTSGENPIQNLLHAIINSGPREDSTRIGRAGTVRRQAVDVSPLRRVNQVT